MTNYDIFNGDADGICALIQLRLEQPKTAQLVTGIKRDINLLRKVDAKVGDVLTVLDISLEKNSRDLYRVLEQGASVFYVDHHQPGKIPRHSALITLIDTDANICTSLLVDKHLGGKYRVWAVTAAFGDNLFARATAAAKPLSIKTDELEQLKLLGICLNYNSYGGCIEDLHFPPDQLYRAIAHYPSPFDFIKDTQSAFTKLRDGYFSDLANAEQITPEFENNDVAVFMLPDAAWSRRISGVYGNLLANQRPDRAHAIVSHNQRGGYLVSVRAPLNNKTGADKLCGSFSTGGGRKGAAGIDDLPVEMLDEFIKRLSSKYKR